MSRHARSRIAGAAGALALALASGPAALAQEDGPDATIVNLMAAIEAKDFEALPTFFCAEFADQVSDLDLSSVMADLPPGTDPAVVLDAFTLTPQIESIDVLSQDDTEAVVMLVGSLAISVNPDALGPFIEALLVAMGQEPTEDMIEMMKGMVAAEMDFEALDISEEITMAPGETMPWVICDVLGGDEEMPGESPASLDPGPVASPDASPSA